MAAETKVTSSVVLITFRPPSVIVTAPPSPFALYAAFYLHHHLLPVALLSHHAFYPDWKYMRRESVTLAFADPRVDGVALLTGKAGGIVAFSTREILKDPTYTVSDGNGMYTYFYRWNDAMAALGDTVVLPDGALYRGDCNYGMVAGDKYVVMRSTEVVLADMPAAIYAAIKEGCAFTKMV